MPLYIYPVLTSGGGGGGGAIMVHGITSPVFEGEGGGMPVGYGAPFDIGIHNLYYICPRAGTLKNGHVNLTEILPSGSARFTIVKNGSFTAMTLTTPTGVTGDFVIPGTVSVVAGDHIIVAADAFLTDLNFAVVSYEYGS